MNASNEEGPRCEHGPSPKHLNLTPKEYDALALLEKESFPCWDPERLREFVGDLISMVIDSQAENPGFNYADACIPEAGMLYVTFDGKGGLNIEPETDCNRAMVDLLRALRRVMGEKLTTGPGPWEVPT